jgi:hypothetical protein
MEEKETLLNLIRLGIGLKPSITNEITNWTAIKTLADEQGLSGIVLDGIERMPEEIRPPQMMLLNWIGEVVQMESTFAHHRAVAVDMAGLFHHNAIRTYVLKGNVIAECYPKPNHRISSDLDCYLLPDKGEFNAWDLGNELIRAKKFEVRTSFYKNSSFFLPGLMVENHQFMTPFRGNDRLASVERVLQALIREDDGKDIFEETWLYRPPVMVSTLFLIEHAYSHFLHEGLTWRMVLDWIMFSKKHNNDIDWNTLNGYIDQFEFRRFYDAYYRMGQYLIGEITSNELTKIDKKMLKDIWAPLDLHETTEGWRGKFALAGNTWRARWKYRYFSEINWIKALWIQAKGVLFIKQPTLK